MKRNAVVIQTSNDREKDYLSAISPIEDPFGDKKPTDKTNEESQNDESDPNASYQNTGTFVLCIIDNLNVIGLLSWIGCNRETGI